jgi:hypothetical protein
MTFCGSSRIGARELNRHIVRGGLEQMLDDISGEFDPITDADSNYGRVIGVKVASRTNPAIAEDMDVSGERKAPVQMLYDHGRPPAHGREVRELETGCEV